MHTNFTEIVSKERSVDILLHIGQLEHGQTKILLRLRASLLIELQMEHYYRGFFRSSKARPHATSHLQSPHVYPIFLLHVQPIMS